MFDLNPDEKTLIQELTQQGLELIHQDIAAISLNMARRHEQALANNSQNPIVEAGIRTAVDSTIGGAIAYTGPYGIGAMAMSNVAKHFSHDPQVNQALQEIKDLAKERSQDYVSQGHYINAAIEYGLYEDTVGTEILLRLMALPAEGVEGLSDTIATPLIDFSNQTISQTSAYVEQLLDEASIFVNDSVAALRQHFIDKLRAGDITTLANHFSETAKQFDLNQADCLCYRLVVQDALRSCRTQNAFPKTIDMTGSSFSDALAQFKTKFLQSLAQKSADSNAMTNTLQNSAARKLMSQLKPDEQKAFAKSYNAQLLEHRHLLLALHDQSQEGQLKLDEALATINYLHEDLIQRKNQAEVVANFQAIQQCFGFIAQLGATTDNKTIQTFGTVGMAVTQGVMGVAQLVGGFGLPEVTGLAALGPYSMVAGSVLTIAMSFMGGSRNKGMMKALKQISRQIAELHKDMLKGFNIVIDHQKFTIELIKDGFQAIDNQLYQLTLGQQIMSEKADDVLNEVKQISAQLQKIGLEADLKALEGLQYGLDKLPEAAEIADNIEFNKMIKKPLAKIKAQLDLALKPKTTALKNQNNHLNGWFHIRNLAALFAKTPFHKFNIQLDDVPNFIWWQFSQDKFFNVMRDYAGFSLSDKSKQLASYILKKIHSSATATNQLYTKLADEEFIGTFFSFYSQQFDTIRQQADDILLGANEKYSKQAMLDFASQYVSVNRDNVNPTWPFILHDIENQTVTLINNHDIDYTRLMALTSQYNTLIREFEFYTWVIFSIFNIDTQILKEIAIPSLLDENYYRFYRTQQVTHKISQQHVRFYYLAGHFDNAFKTLHCSNYLISNIYKACAVAIQNPKTYLDEVSTMAYLMIQLDKQQRLPAAVRRDITQKSNTLLALEHETNNNDNHTKETKIMINAEILNNAMELISLFQNERNKLDADMFTLFAGGSGGGKSTLLNIYFGAQYERAIDPKTGEVYAKLRPGFTEEFPVGRGRDSKTLYPKIKHDVCDLPGWPDNRGDSTRICATSVTDMLTRSVKEIDGLILVIRYPEIAGRGESATDRFLMLGRIMQENLDLIPQSVGLVITHTPHDGITEEMITNLITSALASEQSKTNPNEDEKLLINVLEKLAINKNIMVSNAFDAKQTKSKLVALKTNLTTQPASKFRFTMPTEDQVKFHEQLETVATNYLSFVDDFKQATQTLDHTQIQKDKLTKLIEDTIVKNDELNKAAQQRRNEITRLNLDIQTIDQQLNNAKAVATNHRTTINRINRLNDYRPLTTLYFSQAADASLFKIQEFHRNDVDHHTTFAASRAYKQYQARGINYKLGYGKKYPGQTHNHHCRFVWGWKSETRSHTLSCNYAFPVSFEPTANVNCQFVGNIYTEKGFRATINYPAHLGGSLSVAIKTREKYLGHNQTALNTANAQLKITEEKTAKLASSRALKSTELSKLYVDNKPDQLSQQLGENRIKVENLQLKLKLLQQKETDTKKQIALSFRTCQQHLPTLKTIAKFIKLLKTESPILQSFVEQFSHFEDLKQACEKLIDIKADILPSVVKVDCTASNDSGVHKLGIFAHKSQPTDRSWYTHDQIDQLLNYYLSGLKVDILTGMLGNNWQAGNTLAEQLQQYIAADNLKTAIIPVNLGTYEGHGVHWALIYIDASKNLENPHITFVDPFGAKTDNDVEQALVAVFPKLDKTEICNPKIKFQDDHYNCGPWIVEFARHILNYEGYVPHENFDINQARAEHLETLAACSVEHVKKLG